VRGKRCAEAESGRVRREHGHQHTPVVVHAAYEAFRKLGAAQITIAKAGPSRGTLDLAAAAGYFTTVPKFEDAFTI